MRSLEAENKVLVNAIAEAVAAEECLILQKQILKKELKFVQGQHLISQKAMTHLSEKSEKTLICPRTSLNKSTQDIQTVQQMQRRLSSQMRILTFRKAVMAVLFANRVTKLKPLPVQINHDALTISQIMPLQDVRTSRLIQRLHLSYEMQEQIQSLVSEKTQITGSMLSVFAVGNKSIAQQVNKMAQQHPFDYSVIGTAESKALEFVLSAFKSREFFNRRLLNLEKTFELQRAAALQYSTRSIQQEQDMLRLNEKLHNLQQETIQSFTTCEA